MEASSGYFLTMIGCKALHTWRPRRGAAATRGYTLSVDCFLNVMVLLFLGGEENGKIKQCVYYLAVNSPA